MIIGSTAVCSGNQSDGVTFVDQPVNAIDITNLTTTIGPAAGTPGIELRATTAPGPPPDLTVTTAGSVIVNTINGAAIVVAGSGSGGIDGADAADPLASGGGGTAGGAGHAINIVIGAGAVLTANNNVVVQNRDTQFGLNQLADTNDALAVLDREATLRRQELELLPAYNDANDPDLNPRELITRRTLNLMTQAEQDAYDLNPLISPLLLYPFIQTAQPALDLNIADLNKLKVYLENPPLPEEMSNSLRGVVVARSTGGNGGDGGAGGTVGDAGPPPTAPVGGAGGDGGLGGSITVTVNGTINATVADPLTQGLIAGVLAISRGGNAGDGGSNSIGVSIAPGPTPGVGGTGGDGGTVTVINNGTIKTEGLVSPAIFAQSAGGTGATGGSFSVLAGAGSAGGSGGTVTVTHNGAIDTAGTYGSYGIFAQSIGGTGGVGATGGTGGVGGASGNAMIAVNGTIVTDGIFSHGAFASSLGGKGGAGGDGGGSGGDGGLSGDAAIAVSATGVITTAGSSAHAVYAQSKGGTGGPGDSVGGFWVTSGGGGNGGTGGNAAIDNLGAVSTGGDYAYGLFAQALGGAGGYSGEAVGFVAFSGEGGGGAHSGTVTITNTGTVATAGAGAIGIFAQSVAGGGGDAGYAGGFVALGGTGGSDAQALCTTLDRTFCNDAGAVTVNNAGTIVTTGAFAAGLLAQSVGGGGGNGGNSAGLFAFGGAGGPAGHGGEVIVVNSGGVATYGDLSYALIAQSIGGGGGHGGNATSISGAIPAVSIGGTGGGGGNGAAVDVTNTGSLYVQGLASVALFAQSVGGGGGNGGNASSVGGTPLTLAIGGSGGGGGHGGAVTVSNGGTIITNGDFSDAIVAQSVGGGGGHGGSAYTFGVSAFVSASVSLGGSGGDGGDGGSVAVTNTGAVETFDYDARGIFAQSVGGGGGRGGSSSATAVAVAPNYSLSVAVAVGGSGGGGGIGGTVDVNNDGTIVTWGPGSHGIQAQSVGGGGGSGGDSFANAVALAGSGTMAVSVAVGGTGGDGGDGGAVTVTNRGLIQTASDRSHGIYAQSVGGGGGDGGAGNATNYADTMNMLRKLQGGPKAVKSSATTAATSAVASAKKFSLVQSVKDAATNVANKVKSLRNLSWSKARTTFSNLAKSRWQDFTNVHSYAIGIGVGGGGGIAGDGMAVTVANIGQISTFGSGAYGIVAQSVGGGGGMGGAGSASSDGSIGVGGGWGGNGGASGDGGLVTVNNSGLITTFGPFAYGILAQSVGGGGGVGGMGAGDGGGIKSVSISVGGDAGSFGHGSAVSVTQTGNIVTLGTQSYGILAQSVGGGGGVAYADIVGYELNDDTSPPGSGGDTVAANFFGAALGGKGGAGGNAGNVTVTVTGDIHTEGDGAHGVFAQSVGGGGGVGGSTAAKTFSYSVGAGPLGTFGEWDSNVAFSTSALMGGTGGSAGDGGNIEINTAGTITTAGDYAHGIVAQTIGGGGGYGGGTHGGVLFAAHAGSAGGGGVAGKITITHSGDIFASGLDAHGVFAQSMSGVGSTVCVPVLGCSSSGGTLTGRGDDIAITVNGTISGGSGSGAGIVLSGGKTNTIAINGGLVTSLAGYAIMATDGDDTVNNAGTVTGIVGLGNGANVFNNLTAGTFNTGAYVNLDGGQLTNDGVLSPGGKNAAVTTLFSGDIVQTAVGVYAVDIRFGSSPSDLIEADGTAVIAGQVRSNLLYLMPGGPITVLTATGGVTDAGATVADTLVMNYGLRFPGAALQVAIESVNFAQGNTGGQRSIGGHFQGIWNAGGSDRLAPFMAYLANFEDLSGYSQALNSLSPEAYAGRFNSTLTAGLSFADGLMSCYGNTGTFVALRERECVWARFGGATSTQNATAENGRSRDDTMRMQVGIQRALAPDWFAGFAVGYDETRVSTDSSSTKSEGGTIGVSLKRQMGPWLLAGALTGGYSWFETARNVNTPAPVTARSSSSLLFGDARFRLSYLAEFGPLYFKPYVDADLMYLYAPGFNETGAGALNLQVQTATKFLATVSPSLEFGAWYRHQDGSVIRPYVAAGVTFFSSQQWSVDALFEGTPGGVAPFTVNTQIPRQLGKVSAGIDILGANKFDLRLNYEMKFARDYVSHTGSVKIALPF